MNKFLLLAALVLTLSTDFISAQTDDPYSFGFALTPKTSFVLLENKDMNEASSRTGWNTQILVHYQLSKRWAFVTGIKYSLNRFEQTDYSIVFGSDIDPISGITDTRNSSIFSELNLHYLGVPVEGRYYLKTTNNRVYTKLGFEYFFKIAQDQTNVIYQGGIPLTPFEGEFDDEPKDYGTRASFGLGWETNISDKSTLFLEPEVAYSTTVVNQGASILGINRNPYRFLDIGLRVGIRF
jgi:hypothetical protein